MSFNNSFQEFITKSDDGNQAPSLGIVIRNIFKSCDSENKGSIPISKIIDFIAPFLQGNDEVLEDLRNSLVDNTDRNDENTSIDYETLYRNMKSWTEKMCSSDTTSDDTSTDISHNMQLERTRHNFSVARDLFRNYSEVSESISLDVMELSNDSHEHCIAERCVLENQILELQHQKSQINEELTRIRSEMNSYHDQNESLQGDLDKLVKKLSNEQKLNENLQMEKKKGDEVREELSCANTKIVKMEKTVSSLEKHNNQLQQNFDMLHKQKQNLEQKISNAEKKSEAVVIIRLLESEIDSMKQDLTSEQESNVALLKQNQEFQDMIEHCNIRIDKLKLEKETLEKLVREQVDQNESINDLNINRSILSTSLESNQESDDYEPLRLTNISNESSDEQIYYNFHMLFVNMNSSENLQDEMEKATSSEDASNRLINDENECGYQTKVKQMEVEKKLVTLQCELLQHESCTDIISQQKEEIKHVSQENCNYKGQMESLQELLSDLKTQLSLSQEKERLLLDRCQSLEEDLKSNSSYVAEIQCKLTKYTHLEHRCNILNEKIEELEMDNSMKYIKIVNLTVELEKLRQEQAKAEDQNKKELSKKISQLEKERELHEQETSELCTKIKILNDEKADLQKEKDLLLKKIIESENDRRQLQIEREELRFEKENLKVENFEFRSRNDMVELEFNTFQSEKEALLIEKKLLKNENINLEVAKNELEANMKKSLEKLEEMVECMELEKKSLSTEIGVIKQEKEYIEGDIAKYKIEETLNLQLKEKYEKMSELLEELQVERNLFNKNYEMLEKDASTEKQRNVELTNDNTKMAEIIRKLTKENKELSDENNCMEEEVNELQARINHYVKTNNELSIVNKQLTTENNELHIKVERNGNVLKKMDIDNKQLSVDLVNLKLSFNKVKTTMEKFEAFNESLISENRTLQNSIKKDEELSKQKDLKLIEICTTHENEISILKNELDKIQETKIDLEEILKTKDELLHEMEYKMKVDIENIRLEKKDMLNQINEKQKKIEEITKDLHEQKEIEKKLKLDLEEISKKLRHQNEKYDYISKQIVDIEGELSKEKTLCKTIKENSEKVIFKLENRVAFLETEAKTLNKDKDNFKNMVETSNEKVMELLKINNEFSEKNEKIIEENAELSFKCNNLSEDLIKRKEMLEKANADMKEIWNELKKTEKKVSENEQERLGLYMKKIDRYKDENEKTKGEIESLRREKKIILQKLKSLEKENIETKQQLENLMLEKDAWLTEKINIYKRDAGFGMTKVTTSAKVGSKTTTFDRLTLKNMKLDDKIINLEERLSTERYKNIENSKEIAVLRDNNGLLLVENTRLKKEIDAANENIENLKIKMEELLTKADTLIEENAKLTITNEDFENMRWTVNEVGVSLKKEVSTTPSLSENELLYELNNLREQLENEIRKQDLISTYMDTIKDRLCEKRLRLGRATLHAINVWKNNLEDNVAADASKEGLQPEHLMRPLPGPLDEEVLQIEYQIHVTTSLLDKLTSMENHKLLGSTSSVQNTDFADTLQDETSSNIDRSVLDLSGGCIRLNELSPTEIEDKFTALVLAFTIDRSSLQQRRNRQRNQLTEKERALEEEISMLSDDLEKYTNEVGVLSRLAHILSLSTQISISAEQFGSLTQQHNLSEGVELMMNYVAMLRQNTETLSSQCLSIEPSPEKICTDNETQRTEKETDGHDNLKMELHVANPLETRKSWNKEIRFMITLSMAVLVAVIFLNTFDGFDKTFRLSPLLPPT